MEIKVSEVKEIEEHVLGMQIKKEFCLETMGNTNLWLMLAEIGGRFYIFTHNKFTGKIGRGLRLDKPSEGGERVANFTSKGIKFVSTGRSKSYAYILFNKLTKRHNNYLGEFHSPDFE